jgi:hypothetical protein
VCVWYAMAAKIRWKRSQEKTDNPRASFDLYIIIYKYIYPPPLSRFLLPYGCSYFPSSTFWFQKNKQNKTGFLLLQEMELFFCFFNCGEGEVCFCG